MSSTVLRQREIIRRRRLAACLVVLSIAEEERTGNERRVWTHPYLLRREERGMHHNLFLELALEDPNRFRRCLRMDTSTFESLVQKISPHVKKQDTNMRGTIPPAERLSITLRHLATGETQESLRLSFRIGQSTVSNIIREVCSALVLELRKDFLKVPSSEEEWKSISDTYGHFWNFQNCIGAIDGKHVKIDPPLSSGSFYYNYKETFSVVLMAVVDAHLRFIYVDMGTNGRVSDTGVWNKCDLKVALENNTLHIPASYPLPGTPSPFPYLFVGDEGFPLSTSILIPYPGDQCRNRKDIRIFNYRLSRARRCVENAFGVLGARFQIFRAPMRYDPDVVTLITLTCCCLHNMLRSQSIASATYTPRSFLDFEDEMTGRIISGEWREEPANGLVGIAPQGGNRHRNHALHLRDRWCQYFNGVGAIPWQERMVR